MPRSFKIGLTGLYTGLAAGLLATSTLAGPTATMTLPPPASVSALVSQVDIPYRQFTLPNGLRVVVHTDRKAPIVAVSIWYHIGSKDEPAGETGFAHLFEHLMFSGSENHNADFFKPLQDVGATDYNGTTSFDRTNYFENVPTPALDLALFLEADRMGHLLGAITQAKLDLQRGVVQNEKRQGDNQPFGLTEYADSENLFPAGHPYHHTPIGSMADLDKASLTDVKNWFRAGYGPNNAVLVLAGDIDLATARAKVAQYFGSIPAGPAPARFAAPVPDRKATTRLTLHDKVTAPRLSRYYVIPGRTDPVTVPVDIAASILAGGASSRLYNDLVRDKQLAVSVSGGVQAFEKVGEVEFDVDLKPGVDPAAVNARIDAVFAQFLKDGPTADEVARVVTRNVAGTIRGLEKVGGFGGKAVTLAEGAVYAGDAGFYRTELQRYAAATPASVTAAARRWLARGDFRLTTLPGPREATVAEAAPVKLPPQHSADGDTSKLPKVTGTPELVFPALQRTTLANGLQVVLAQRATVPVVHMTLSFDAGNAADPHDKLGTQHLMLSLLDEGTATRSGRQIAEAEERLGTAIGAGSSSDRTRLSLNALKPNLTASLELFSDIVRNATFAPEQVERLRNIALTGIADELNDPQSVALRTLPPLLYGPGHPYGVPLTGSGTTAGLKAVTRADLVAFRDRWLRPDNAVLFVAGDIGMAELKPLLEAVLGDWRPVAGVAKGVKTFPAVPPATAAHIVLIDRPASPQSLIAAGKVLAVKGTDDTIPLRAANDVIGGDFFSRLNTDLRETKGWSYGVTSSIYGVRETEPLLIVAPVQTDRTGDSITAMIADTRAVGGTKPIDGLELRRVVNGITRALPGEYETAGAVLGAIESNYVLDRPDDYQVTLARRYRALTVAELNAQVPALSSDGMTWIVVGDRKLVEPQLKATGLPVEVR